MVKVQKIFTYDIVGNPSFIDAKFEDYRKIKKEKLRKNRKKKLEELDEKINIKIEEIEKLNN